MSSQGGKGHENMIFGEKKVSKLLRRPWAVEKHVKALEGTGFEKCATCYGCAGEIVNGCMRCSRVGPKGALIKPGQAQRCDGTKPPNC